MASLTPWPHSPARQAVLIVEDEPLQRMMAVGLVEEAGFEALAAANAGQALAMLEQRADIRVVFTDIDLHLGMNGMRMATVIRDRWPPIAFIMTSGQVEGAQLELPQRSCFFTKPYRREDILGALHSFMS